MKKFLKPQVNPFKNLMTDNLLTRNIRNFSSFNPPKFICDHLVGKNHTPIHRMAFGSVTILIGVLIAKSGGEGITHILTDCVGYFIHGVGSMPFLEFLDKWRDK